METYSHNVTLNGCVFEWLDLERSDFTGLCLNPNFTTRSLVLNGI